MFNFLTKFIFYWKKPKIVIVTGEGKACATEAIFQVLRNFFKVEKIKRFSLKNLWKNEILILESKIEKVKPFKFLIKSSQLSILVVTQIGQIPPEVDFFAGEREKTEKIREVAKILPPFAFLILNFDDETVREIKDETNLKEITFGFQEKADFRATDIKLNTGTNFKVNYKGNIVPIWLEKVFGKEQIYSALAACAVGTIFDLNLVEISQSLKNYQSLPGKMRLIEGIKNSSILDDSENASPFSMAEALEILGKIEAKRKIAVLGDILGIEKYVIEAHEAIGERVTKVADLLFTVGSRAKFFAQGAFKKGMEREKIFQFEEIEEAKKNLKKEIKEGDLILVDGSKEMRMGEIIKEIKAG
jgi:UDP-N-acetylmuramoyl-tripeptide--D-alanyl-D-alanine ligase